MIGRVSAVAGIAGVLVAFAVFALGGGSRRPGRARLAPKSNSVRTGRGETIAPALTPDEWADAADKPGLRAVELARGMLLLSNDEIGLEGELMRLAQRERHQVAAFCLHAQPFGFTWDDVDVLRAAGPELESTDRPSLAQTFDGIVGRLAALLPPRGYARTRSARELAGLRSLGGARTPARS